MTACSVPGNDGEVGISKLCGRRARVYYDPNSKLLEDADDGFWGIVVQLAPFVTHQM